MNSHTNQARNQCSQMGPQRITSPHFQIVFALTAMQARHSVPITISTFHQEHLCLHALFWQGIDHSTLSAVRWEPAHSTRWAITHCRHPSMPDQKACHYVSLSTASSTAWHSTSCMSKYSMKAAELHCPALSTSAKEPPSLTDPHCTVPALGQGRPV